MRLNKVEKIIVAVILLGVILVGGAFMFVVPTFDKMDKATKTRDANMVEKQNLEQELSRLNTIDDEIKETKDNAVKYEGNFYPDLTTYETSEIAMALMKKCNLESHAISINPISTRDLTLEYNAPSELEYSLKTFAQAARATDNGEEESEVLLEGEFMDGKKRYKLVLNSVAGAMITDENGEEVAPSKYSEKMKKTLKAAVCKYVQENNKIQTVACTQATYDVKGKFSDYIKFIDYIYSLPRATLISTVTIPMTTEIKEEKDKDNDQPVYYVNEDGSVTSADQAAKGKNEVVVEDDTVVEETITLIFLSVEPMSPLSRVDAGGEKIVVDQRPAVY